MEDNQGLGVGFRGQTDEIIETNTFHVAWIQRGKQSEVQQGKQSEIQQGKHRLEFVLPTPIAQKLSSLREKGKFWHDLP